MEYGYEYQPIPHVRLNFLLWFNVCSNMRPYVTAPKTRTSNGWLMRTEVQIFKVRSINNLPNSCRTKPHAMFQHKKTVLCTASDRNHAHLIRLPSTAYGEVSKIHRCPHS